MSDYDFIKMQKKLAKYLDENRYEHTLGVMFTCASLAMVHGYDLKNAQWPACFMTVQNVFQIKKS